MINKPHLGYISFSCSLIELVILFVGTVSFVNKRGQTLFSYVRTISNEAFAILFYVRIGKYSFNNEQIQDYLIKIGTF